jgi:hypothetical protein
MRNFLFIAFGLIVLQDTAAAQTNPGTSLAETAPPIETATGVIGATSDEIPHEFTPLTESEKLRLYLRRAFGPAAIARAAAAGGIAQSTNTPKEWRRGADGYGKRVGTSMATHIIDKTLEYGASELLREDNRYIRSGEGGFGKRVNHAFGAVFVARNEGGRGHFAYSRFGGAAGAAFISRLWQPHSTNSAGDAAVTFGVIMATDIVGNFLHEFWPARKDVPRIH